MPTIYAAPAAVGSGDGSSAGNARSLASAASLAASGDTVLLVDGTYTSFPTPTNNNITFQAINTNGPVFEGGTLMNSWSLANGTGTLSYTSGSDAPGSNIYRSNTSLPSVGGMIWANDFVSPLPAGNGRNCALWNTGFQFSYQQSVDSRNFNPGLRIHTFASAVCNNLWGQPLYSDTFQFRVNTDGTYGPAGTVDARFNNDNPSSYTIYSSAAGVLINLNSKSGITYKGIKVRRWTKFADLSSCNGIVFDTCDFRYAGNDHGFFVNASNNCTWKNCSIVGVGSILSSNADGFQIVNGSSNITIDGCTILYCGHDGVVCYTAVSNNQIKITNCEIGYCDSGINFTNSDSSATDNCQIAGNFIHDCGMPGFTGLDGQIRHDLIEISNLTNSTIRHNVMWRGAEGIYISGGKPITGVKGNKFYHNTFADCRIHCVTMESLNPNTMILNNTFTDNLYYWTNNSSDPNNPSALMLNLFTGGTNPPWGGNTWNGELFYSPGSGNIIRYFRSEGDSRYTTVAAAVSAGLPITNSIGAGNSTSDPKFTVYTSNAASAIKNNFQLQSSSPAKNAAVAVSNDPVSPDPDIGNTVWTAGSNVGPSAATITATPATGTSPLTVSFSGNYNPGNGASYSFSWNFNTTSVGGTVSPTTSSTQTQTVTFANSSAVTYVVSFRVTDNNSLFTDAPTQNIAITLPSNNTVLQNGSVLAAFATVAVPPSSTDTTSVQAASVGPPYSGSYAFDNQYGTADIDSTEWIKDPTTNLPATLTCDLTGQVGINMDVDQIRIMFRKYNNRTHGYNIKQSQDAATWTTLIAPTNSILTSQWNNHTFSLTRTRFLQLQITSASDGTQNAGVAEMQIYAKAVAAGGGGGGGGGGQGVGYTWVSFTDPLGSSRTPFGPQQLLLGRDPTKLDAMARWLWDLGMPVDLIGDMGSNKSVGRVRIFPFKAAQGIVYTMSIALQQDGSGTYTTVASGISTSISALYTDISFTAAQARKIKITFISANRGVQCGAWKCEAFAL